MSLINDALRKARQAAAEHEDQRSMGRAPQAYPSRGPRRGVGVVTMVLVAVVCGVGGAAMVWWFADGPAARHQSDAEASRTLTTPAVHSSPNPRPSDPTESLPVSGEFTAEAGTDPVPNRAVPAAPTRVSSTTTAPEPSPDNPVADQPAETPAGHGALPASTDATDRVFVMDADLGYASLSLGYIVFRPVRPFAEINGIEIYEGSEVEGFTVEKIEIDRIVLKDNRGRLILRVP